MTRSSSLWDSRSFLLGCFLALILCPSVSIAEPAYETGTLVGIEKKVKITPLSYVFETVVSYYETVTYELEIRAGNQVYFTDYTPDVQPNGPLPSEWKPGLITQFRIAKRRLFVKVSYNGEIETFIARSLRPKRP